MPELQALEPSLLETLSFSGSSSPTDVKLPLGGSPSNGMGSNACSSPNTTRSPSSSLTGTPTFGSTDSPPNDGIVSASCAVGPLGSISVLAAAVGPVTSSTASVPTSTTQTAIVTVSSAHPSVAPNASGGTLSAATGNTNNGTGAANSTNSSTKCGLCQDTFTIPKVLSCLHTFCQPCLEKVQECPDKMKCPQCGVETPLPVGAGVVGLLSDYAISRMLENAALDGANPSSGCTSCKSKDSSAIARCLDCANFLCPNCVMAHQFMHCFEGHRVMTLGELQSCGNSADSASDGSHAGNHKSSKPVLCSRHKNEPLKFFCHTCNLPVCNECTVLDHPKALHDFDLLAEVAPKHIEGLAHLIEEGRAKSEELKAQLRNAEQVHQKMQLSYQKAQAEVNETFQFYRSMVDERRHEILKELESVYNAKVLAIGLMQKNAQEVVDRILRVSNFVDRLIKFSSNTEVMVFKQLLDAKFQNVLSYQPDINGIMHQNLDLEFVSNFQAIQVGVRNTFGYIKQGLEAAQSASSAAGINAPLMCNGGVPHSGSGGLNGVTGVCLSTGISSGGASSLQAQQHQPHLPKTLAPIGRPSGGVIGAERLLLNSTSTSGLTSTSNTNSSLVGSGISGSAQQHIVPGLSMSAASAVVLSPSIYPSALAQQHHQHQVQPQQSVHHQQNQPHQPHPHNHHQQLQAQQQLTSSTCNNGSQASSSVSVPSSSSNVSLTSLPSMPSIFDSSTLSKRLSSASSLGPFSTSLDLNPYEKWSTGGCGDIFAGSCGSGGSAGGTAGTGVASPADFSTGLAAQVDHHSLGNVVAAVVGGGSPLTGPSGAVMGGVVGNGGPGGPGAPAAGPVVDLSSLGSTKFVAPPPSSMIYPLKSQLKRQKMIYHCKFGEFGVMEGQFTEPSGVAVNAQNDIIVADTNNHRIQIFDKEGRFKFQFGECGKRDGQLLYPNRVSVVKTSGDIIVTERSPTHQIQVYNQYGQFVRKFGANILQHPRGITVDNKGRIIVVECKVMRVLIFDQVGNVLQKFGCSKHLEFPNGVVVNDKQEIFISDNRAHCVKVFNYEGAFLRQIGGEGLTNYPIGVCINQQGEILVADNHNNFNITIFTQDGQLVNALESKVKHAQCFDVALMDDGSVVLASKDYRLYIYRYIQVPALAL